MLKRILALVILAAMAAALLAGCGEPSYSFTEAQGKYKIMGLKTQVTLDNVTLYFEGEDSSVNTQITADMQRIIQFVGTNFTFSGSARAMAVCIFDREKMSLIAPDTNRVMISGGDTMSTGAMVSALSGYTLPAWLCAGIELYAIHGTKPAAWLKQDPAQWAEAAAASGGPGFGDYWFLPDVGTSQLKTEFLGVCYTVVCRLEEQGVLAQAVASFVEGDREGALATAAQALAHVGDVDSGCIYVYGLDDSYIEIDRGDVRYAFKTWSWDLNRVLDFADYMDTARDYVCQWLEFEPLQKVLVNIIRREDGGTYNNWDLSVSPMQIELSIGDEAVPFNFTHEYIHTMTLQICSGAFYLPIDEGMAEAIRLEFYAEHQPDLPPYPDIPMQLNALAIREADAYAQSSLAVYERIAGKPYVPDDMVDMYAYAQAVCYYVIASGDDRASFKRSYPMHPLIDGYAKSCAFVYYLIEAYGKDVFLSAFHTSADFEAAYGASLAQMIDEWALWLGLE